MTTPSARGKANRRKGHDTERMGAVYLRQWWPEAARKADTGWRRGDIASLDVGDIRGTPGITWQFKHVQALNVAKAMAETANQAVAAGADYGVMVQRRPGHADPGMWWAWLTVADIGRLLVPDVLAAWGVCRTTLTAPVRLELQHVVALLLVNGYGTPLKPGSDHEGTA